jgi:uncharacterized tellurite resistance protein B-like protein
MLPKELEQLVEAALADGTLTEKERKVLFKKADLLGIDPDEFEIILDGRLHELNKSKQAEFKIEKVNDKYGELKKCPACNSMIESFSTVCKSCGYEFRNTSANKALAALINELNKIEADCNRKDFSTQIFFSKIFETDEYVTQKRKDEINRLQSSCISHFVIPNNREDIMEFIHFAYPKIKTGEDTSRAWRRKFKEAVNRATLAYSGDTVMLDKIATYKTDSNPNWFYLFYESYNSLSKQVKMIILLFVISFSMITIGILSSEKETEKAKQARQIRFGVEQEQVRLSKVLTDINDMIKQKDYEQAITHTRQLNWEYFSPDSATNLFYINTYSQKRDSILKDIKSMKKKK